MPTAQEQLISKILTTIDTATEQFSSNIPALQRQILNEVTLLVKDLDISSDGKIKNNVANLKTIGRIKSKLEQIVLNEKYLKDVSKFTEAFDEVARLQNQYFNLIEKTFKPSKLLAEIQKQSINAAIVSLTESGIGVNVIEEIQAMLRRNVTLGGSYAELQTQLRNSIISNKSGQGLLERYTKSVTIDSIMQFNRQYSHAVSDDLNLKWRIYTGTLITTSREWCEWMVKKRYIHVSEYPEIMKGHILDHHVKMNPKTGLWLGANKETTVSNLEILAGGHSCAHTFAPVSAAVVPANIRAQFPE